MATQKELMMEIDGPNGLLNRSKVHYMKRDATKFQSAVMYTCFAFMAFLFFIASWGVFNPATPEDIAAYNELSIRPAQAATQVAQVVPAQPASIEETPELPPPTIEESSTVDPNSYQNFDTAKQVIGMCQTNDTCQDMVRRWETVGYSELDVIRMILIMNKESGWQYDQVSTNTDGSKDCGAYQINTGYHCGKVGEARNSQACVDALLDPDTNTRVAMEIFDRQGWTPWYARLAYLPEFYADRVTL
jgi:hypothetical protein